MSSRMDKYNDSESVNDNIPTRSDKNKELYKQIYNAYDSFENLIVPSNAREIKPSELKKEITSRDEYRRHRDYDDISGNKTNNTVIRKEKMLEEQRKEEEVYDINLLLDKATKDVKEEENSAIQTLSNREYLKRLKLDNRQMNLDKLKEQYEEDNEEDDETLMKTANLSLEILSDLKGDSSKTVVSAPIKNEERPVNDKDNDFYSSTYKFSKKDFDGKDTDLDIEDDDYEMEETSGNSRFFFKIFIIVLCIVLLGILVMFLFNYLNRV